MQTEYLSLWQAAPHLLIYLFTLHWLFIQPCLKRNLPLQISAALKIKTAAKASSRLDFKSPDLSVIRKCGKHHASLSDIDQLRINVACFRRHISCTALWICFSQFQNIQALVHPTVSSDHQWAECAGRSDEDRGGAPMGWNAFNFWPCWLCICMYSSLFIMKRLLLFLFIFFLLFLNVCRCQLLFESDFWLLKLKLQPRIKSVSETRNKSEANTTLY